MGEETIDVTFGVRRSDPMSASSAMERRGKVDGSSSRNDFSYRSNDE